MAERVQRGGQGRSRAQWSWFVGGAALAVAMVLSGRQTAYTAYSLEVHKASAIPAFARKYGLPCSACHTAWPELNAFGQAFRDRGYQLGNDRDSPIYQNPSYIPITFRMTPNWHLERTDHQPVDAQSGNPASGLVEGTITQSGFDLSGMDLWLAGTLFKDISFSLLPSSNNLASFHFENAYVRFDNLLASRWVNFKLGKFELDNLVSEKRFLFISGNGGLYQSYHFVPVGDATNFGLGDNQLGVELAGHSDNSYTRYGVAVLSSSEGAVGLPSNKAYDTYLTFSQAFDAGKLGVERIGAYAYVGQRSTGILTSSAAPGTPPGGTTPIPGTGFGNKSFYRVGVAGDLFLGDLELLPFFMHASDDVYLATGTAADSALPAGARSPVWNSGFLEAHYYVSPQLVFTGRYETVQMSHQALASTPGDLGNINAYSFGCRWYPIMFSRAGLSWHGELSRVKTQGAVPLSFDGVGAPPLSPATGVWSTSVFVGLDFDF
jgi:hypothetical protein